MDRISSLPDDLLLRILSLAPTKDAVATSLLSKRWSSLWKMVPRLEFDHGFRRRMRHVKLMQVIYRCFLLHKAPVLDCLSLQLDSTCLPVDVATWVGIAVDRRVREVKIDFGLMASSTGFIRLPNSLYRCGTLETLSLRSHILMDVPSSACFRSLKTLHLLSVTYKEEDSIDRLLSSCPVLETLVVERSEDLVFNFAIEVPSLQRLTVRDKDAFWDRFVVNAPSLKHLTISGNFNSNFFHIENMPELVEATILAERLPTEKLLKSITSAKLLSLSVSPLQVPYPTGCTFYRLLCLELITKDVESLSLLMCLLEHTPKLRALNLLNPFDDCYRDPLECWDQPSRVPECLSFHLESFKWGRYRGKRQEREVATYILTNARQLKSVAVSLLSVDAVRQQLMMEELTSAYVGSTAYELTFDSQYL